MPGIPSFHMSYHLPVYNMKTFIIQYVVKTFHILLNIFVMKYHMVKHFKHYNCYKQ